MMDFEGTSDAFVRSYFNPDQDQKTDTHFRCKTGKASFNWRHLFPVKSLQGEYLLTVQAWDWDLIGGNELIGECQIDVEPLMSDTVITNNVRSLNYTYFNSHYKQTVLNKQSSLSS